MVESVVEQRIAIQQFQYDGKFKVGSVLDNAVRKMTGDSWKMLENLTNLLRPFEAATKQVSIDTLHTDKKQISTIIRSINCPFVNVCCSKL
jgi:hypothetical protein